ncbi:MAG: hypothetical protein HY554_09825, partial [Elusimicrobia bacterium]|nr:hypothetical protein [Elusimicrobiota bacterium]
MPPPPQRGLAGFLALWLTVSPAAQALAAYRGAAPQAGVAAPAGAPGSAAAALGRPEAFLASLAGQLEQAGRLPPLEAVRFLQARAAATQAPAEAEAARLVLAASAFSLGGESSLARGFLALSLGAAAVSRIEAAGGRLRAAAR